MLLLFANHTVQQGVAADMMRLADPHDTARDYSMTITALKRTLPFIIAAVKKVSSCKTKSRRANTKCFICFLQWKGLNHAVDILHHGKIDSILRIKSMTRRPRMDRKTIAELNLDQTWFSQMELL